MAFLGVGAIAVWSAVGFNTASDQAGVSVAGASTPKSPGNTTQVSDSGTPSPGATSGSDSGGGADTPDSSGKAEQTKYGPLTAADRDFMDKVRQAGAWEGPTGRQAQERAGSQKVKDVGLQLAADHAQLDAKVIAVAQQLGHKLPDGPSAAQQGWMNELSQVEGEEYDRLFADRLRAAHGKVFAVVADIRAGTKNGMIRQLAQTTNVAVMKHMTILEGTGFVNFSELADAENPEGAAPTGNDNNGKKVPPRSGQDSGSSGSNSNGNPGPTSNPGNDSGQFGQDLSQDRTQIITPTSSSRKTTGVDNYIIVIMLAVAGVISAITYRQLHRRRS